MSTSENKNPDYPSELRSVLELIDREVDRQAEVHARASTAVSTRAALLISTSVIFVSLPQSENAGTIAYLVSLALAVVSALFGAIALLMKRQGEEIRLGSLEEKVWNMHELQALRAVTAAKLLSLEQDRELSKYRHRMTIVGFIFLIFSLTATVMYLIFGI